MSRFPARHYAGTLWSFTKSGLMLIGLIALLAWEIQTFSHPSSLPVASRTEALPALEAVKPARLASEVLALASNEPDDRRAAGSAGDQRRIASYLAKKYRVAGDAVESIVSASYVAGRDIGVDPHLILAVMAIESRFNPFAESVMGAKGLMQVIPKYHMDKFEAHGGLEAVLDPVANIRVGAAILKDYVTRFGGVEAGLKAYSGATEDDMGYPAKVLAERDRLKAAVGIARVIPARAIPRPATARPIEPT